MKGKYSHNKLKNTGILFELLIRQITSDILNNSNKMFAEQLLRKHFKKNSELTKELSLFQSLIYDKFNKIKLSEELINVVLQKRKKLNERKLKSEKYNLIKDLRENLNIDEFMKSRINNYTLMSSIQSLFDNSLNQSVPPSLVVKSRNTILEHIQTTSTKQNDVDDFVNLDNDIKMLSVSIMTKKFNNTYSGLNEQQKKLLSMYVGTVSDNIQLKKYIKEEIEKTQNTLLEHKRKTDSRIQIKLEKVIDKLNEYKTGQLSNDNDVEILLRAYTLIEKLNTLK